MATLNDLAGGRGGDPSLAASSGQTQCMSRLVDSYRQVGPPDPSLTPAGAFEELCGSCPGYAIEDEALMNLANWK